MNHRSIRKMFPRLTLSALLAGVAGASTVTRAAVTQYIDLEDATVDDGWNLNDNGTSYHEAWREGTEVRPRITNFGRSGSHSVAMQVGRSNNANKDRIEYRYAYFRTEETRFTGFSVFFPTDFTMTPDMRLVFMQWWQGPVVNPDTGASPYPSIELIVVPETDPGNGDIKLAMNVARGTTDRETVTRAGTTTARKGQWLDMVTEWRVSPSTSDGLARWWVNGALVADHRNNVGLTDQSNVVDIRWGIYRNRHNQSQSVPYDHTIYFDELRNGASYAEVLPGQIVPEPTGAAVMLLLSASLTLVRRRRRLV